MKNHKLRKILTIELLILFIGIISTSSAINVLEKKNYTTEKNFTIINLLWMLKSMLQHWDYMNYT